MVKMSSTFIITHCVYLLNYHILPYKYMQVCLFKISNVFKKIIEVARHGGIYPVIRRLKQEDYQKFKASLRYSIKLSKTNSHRTHGTVRK